MDRLGGTFGAHDDASGYDEYGFEDDSDFSDFEEPASPVGQDERRMQVRAYNHWAALLDNRNFPSVETLDPSALDDFGPYSVVLDFGSGAEDPSVRFLGSRLAEECDAMAAIGRLSDIPGRSLLSRITDHYLQIIANEAPIGFEAEFVNQRGLNVLYRGILLPYSSDGETIDHILGVINWKELADQQTADELLLEIDQALETGGDTGDLPAHDGGAPAPDAEVDWDAAGSPLSRKGAHRAEPDEFAGDGYAIDEEEPDYWVDYGDQGLEDEGEAEDVDDVVDPLADDSAGSGLASLVARGPRRKPLVDLDQVGPLAPFEADDDFAAEAGPDTAAPIPLAYEPEPESAPVPVPSGDTPISPDAESEPADELDAADLAGSLHDTLAAARELALAAQSSEDRTRGALYRAVGRAYDVSIEAAENPEEFATLLADSGLTAQERAPMTPVVKLVFGSGYDKTRVTEYAAVLAQAHRIGIGRGLLDDYLAGVEGGLKAVIAAERRARRKEAGEPAVLPGIRPALADKLRALPAIALDELDPDGPEFALVMIRRNDAGQCIVVGEIPDDAKLVERAGRRLLR